MKNCVEIFRVVFEIVSNTTLKHKVVVGRQVVVVVGSSNSNNCSLKVIGYSIIMDSLIVYGWKL